MTEPTINNRQKAFNIFVKDGELQDMPNHDDAGKTSMGLKLKHIQKSKTRCPKCFKISWRVSLDFDNQPEWTYYCDKCEIKFICVMESATQ